MRHVLTLAAAALAATVSAPAVAGDVAPAATPAKYSTAGTDIGTLMDSTAAWAIVLKHIPEFAGNEQLQMARPMTLKAIQGFAAEQITDARLTAIDAELAALPG